MKKNFYFAPSIEEDVVLVENGIAASGGWDSGTGEIGSDSEDI